MDTSSLNSAIDTGVKSAEGGTTQAGYGESLTSAGSSTSFADKLNRLESAQLAEPSESTKALFKPFERLNTEAHELTQYANEASASGEDLTHSEIVMLTVKSQEFMFHATLTANVANRTSDGVQQLFKQQG